MPQEISIYGMDPHLIIKDHYMAPKSAVQIRVKRLVEDGPRSHHREQTADPGLCLFLVEDRSNGFQADGEKTNTK